MKKGGERTYGEITIDSAINRMTNGYAKIVSKPCVYNVKDKTVETVETKEEDNGFNPSMNIDAFGNPIFKIKKIFQAFPLNDTGNAERFYAYLANISSIM